MKLSAQQSDALAELINIGVGKAASVLNTMLNSHVTLQVPFVRLLDRQEYLAELSSLGANQLSSVQLTYQGEVSGRAQLVFPTPAAAQLITVLTGEEEDSGEFDLIRAGTLSEVGNIVINGLMGSISNILNQHFTYTVPTYLEDTAENLVAANGATDNMTILLARTRFSLETHSIEGDLILIFQVGALDAMLRLMGVGNENV